MKRILISILAVALSLSASAQGHFNTKRFKIKDFREKVTKIVISGNDIAQTTLSQEVLDRWTISAFELCTQQEFEANKKSSDYYFLLLTDGINRGGISAGITYLTLVKGGPEASKGIGSMPEVVSLPVCSSASSEGRELAFMGAFVEIIQDYTLRAIESEYNAYMGLTIFNKLNLGKNGSRKIIHISQDDIDPSLAEAKWHKYTGPKLVVEEDADDIYSDGTPDALVSYVVAPSRVSGKAYAYKMLIEAGTGKLFYYHKERIRAGHTYGFNELDLGSINRLR